VIKIWLINAKAFPEFSCYLVFVKTVLFVLISKQLGFQLGEVRSCIFDSGQETARLAMHSSFCGRLPLGSYWIAHTSLWAWVICSVSALGM